MRCQWDRLPPDEQLFDDLDDESGQMCLPMQPLTNALLLLIWMAGFIQLFSL
jgi:hypothetical protein